ncbi:MAG: hypothetical protein JXJ04_09380 [Spirochaetales bacterium]|nr:hypothetical protein [Spirochaetales bacterium]
MKKGDYNVFVRGSSTEVDGVYSKVIVTIDTIKMDEIEIASSVPDVFLVGTCFLDQGTHVVTLSYTNDLYKKGQDRNLFFQAIGFELKNDILKETR